MLQRPRTTLARTLALLAALGLVASFALAAHPIAFDASGMPTRDADRKEVDKIGAGVTCDGGFAFVFAAKDRGNLGNVVVDGYTYAELTKDALSRVDPVAAAHRLGVLDVHPQGTTVTVEKMARDRLMARTAGALAASGCTIGEQLGRGFGFTFTDAHGAAYRATFASVADGAAVYVGH